MAASVALVAAGVLAVAQFASSDDAPVANAAQEDAQTPPTPAPATTPQSTSPDAAPPTTAPAGDTSPQSDDLDGQIVIQVGDGEPIVIDLGELGALGGGLGDLGSIEQCIGEFPFDIDLDAATGSLGLPGFEIFGDGETVTVTGPDGLSVLTFGEGDGSVTISKNDGELTISSDGDVQVDDLGALDGSAPLPSLPALPDLGQIYECLEDATGNG